MGKNAIYVWIGLAVLFVILYTANKQKEQKAGAGGYVNINPQAIGSKPCFCNGYFIGYMNKKACRKACRKAVKFETL